MPLQLTIFGLLFGGLQGLLLTLFLVRKKLFHSGYIFLLLYFGVMILQITLKVMSKAWLMENWLPVYYVSYILPLLYGPLIWLFVQQVLAKKNFTQRRNDAKILQKSKSLRAFASLRETFHSTHFRVVVHFLPFLIMSVYLLNSMNFESQVIWFLYRYDVRLVMQLVSIAGYHAVALFEWHRYKTELKSYYSETHRQQINWLRQFIIASAITCLIVTIALYFLYKYYTPGSNYRYWFVILTVFIYWVSYSVLSKPAVFSVIRGHAPDIDESFTPSLTIHRREKKYNNSRLSIPDQTRISRALENLMAGEKIYLDPALTIQNLADRVQCSRHHLSQVLNENIGKSFYDYVNGYRVEEARSLLLDPSHSEDKIASIAYDAGFNSLSTFNEVFRKHAGMTPSQYRKKVSRDRIEKRG